MKITKLEMHEFMRIECLELEFAPSGVTAIGAPNGGGKTSIIDFLRAAFGGKAALEILYASTSPKALQAEIDVAWVARGGGDPAAWCRRVKGRMDQVHLKDWMMIGEEPSWTEVGEGIESSGSSKEEVRNGAH